MLTPKVAPLQTKYIYDSQYATHSIFKKHIMRHDASYIALLLFSSCHFCYCLQDLKLSHMEINNMTTNTAVATISSMLFMGAVLSSCTTLKDKSPKSNAISSAIREVELTKLESLIPYQTGDELHTGDPIKGSLNGAISLRQGWTEDSQEEFYYTSQGSQILPYDWFLALEQASGKKLFRANNNISAMAYIPTAPTERNPDALPVGFARASNPLQTTDDAPYYESWVGMTCAACHSTEVESNGVVMRVNGGPALADFQLFNAALIESLEATLKYKGKFNRFAKKVLDTDNSLQRETLRRDLKAQAARLQYRTSINHSDKNQPDYGYGRVDAIGEIFNQITTIFNHSPENARSSTAPVSYPFLWGTHQSDFVQWTGFAPNGPYSLGALIRNGGEVLGVYGQIDIPEDKSKTAYPSTLSFKGLGHLEARVAQLRSPAWPEDILGEIDSTKHAEGQALYATYCESCHQVIPRENEGKPYKAVLTDLSEIQTDSQEIINLVGLRNANRFYNRKEFGAFGPKISYTSSGLEPLVNSVMGSIADQPLAAIEAVFIQYFGGELAAMPGNGIHISAEQKAINKGKVKAMYQKIEDAFNIIQNTYHDCELNKITKKACKALVKVVTKGALLEGKRKDKDKSAETLAGMVYKGRPLNGIWATAPYLHNGSVPNLYELLLPANERLKHFYVGSRELDLKKVGFNTEKTSRHTSLFDTSRLGNSNSGHEYGTQLNAEQRMAMIEYMKSL